jgi:hypothetical protein
MAIIYSYPLTTPKVKDLLIGTSVFDEDDENSPRNNPTVSFTIESLLGMIGTGGFQTLQQVTNLGASTTNAITIANGLSVNGTFTDSAGLVGTTGQVLSSTVIGTAWVDDNAGLNYYVTGGSFNDQNGSLVIIGNNALVGASIDLDGRYMSSLTTTGTTGASTFNAATGVLNIPNYVSGVTSVNSMSNLFAYKGILVTPSSGAVKVGLNIHDLSAVAAIEDEDEIVIVDNPNVNPYNKKTTVGDLKTHINTNTTYDYLAVGSIPSGTVNSPPMGTGYSSAINVATTGGSGTGMTVDTTVVSGGVQTVTINNPGTGYIITDTNIVISGGNSGAIMSLSGTVGETNPNLRLVDSAFAFDDVKLTGGNDITITRTSDSGITIASTGSSDNWYVTGGSFNTINGELSITGNNVAVGATIDLDGRYMSSLTTIGTTGLSTFTAATGVLNVPNYTFTEVDTLQSVCARESTTDTSITMTGTGVNGYLYVTGNTGPSNPIYNQGFAVGYNNSAGSSETEMYFNTYLQTAGDNDGKYNSNINRRMRLGISVTPNLIDTSTEIAVSPTTAGSGYTAGTVSVTGGGGSGMQITITVDGSGGILTGALAVEGINYVAADVGQVVTVGGTGTSGTFTLVLSPFDTRLTKTYGNGKLELYGSGATVGTPYITLPIAAGGINSLVKRTSAGGNTSTEFTDTLSYNETNATLAILPASGTVSEIQMKSANNSIWKLTISNSGALVIDGPF